MFLNKLIAVGALVAWGFAAQAQGTEVSFGSGGTERDEPIEVSAESLAINQDDGTAEYLGDVVIVQGDLKLAAPRVLIVYDEDAGEIDRMEASGGVTLVSAEDAAEAEDAVYYVRDGNMHLTGNVLLSQGINVLASDEMVLNLDDGTARILGRVRTVLNPDRDN